MRVGAQHLDSLQDSQMDVQEASGVMAVAMLWQQGVMQEVAILVMSCERWPGLSQGMKDKLEPVK